MMKEHKALEAIELLESLVLACMAAGMFKKFDDLDKVRRALAVLSDIAIHYELPINKKNNEQSERGSETP